MFINFLKWKCLIFTDKKLWWADHNLGQLGTCNKKDGRNPTVLRNKTSGVVHMKVYDKARQKGKPRIKILNNKIHKSKNP